MRRRTRSPRGNASGSPSARIAMYSAVQSPMPGMVFSAAMVASASKRESNAIVSSTTRRASGRIVSARARTMPVCSCGGETNCAGAEARDSDRTAAAVDRNRAPIARLGDRFDAGRRARAEKRQHGVPVVRRAIGEPEAIAICIRLGGRSLPGETPQLCRRACVRAANLGVESPKASEAGRDRDLMEREARLVDELLGEMRASGKGDVERRRAEVLQEQAPQVSRGDAEPIRK